MAGTAARRPAARAGRRTSRTAGTGARSASVHSVQRPTGSPAAAQARERVDGEQGAVRAAAWPRAGAPPTPGSSGAVRARPSASAGGDIWRRVEGVDGAQHAATEAFQAFGAHGLARRWPPFAADLDEHGGKPMGVERALLAHGERETQGGRAGRSRWGRPGPSRAPGRSRRRPCAAAEAVRSRSRPRRARRRACAHARAGEVAEHDRRVERARRRVSREVGRARVTAAAAARRHEDDRAPGLARGEHARELEQRRRPRQFGLRAVARRRRGGRGSRSAWRRSSPVAGRSPW